MKQTIRMKGLTLAGDEMAAEHGELALCGDVELYDGAIRPAVLEGTALAEGNSNTHELLYIHVTSSYRHFIFRNGNNILCFKETSSGWVTITISPSHAGFDASKIISIKSVGNTLCITTDAGLFYYLCKYDTWTEGGQTVTDWRYQYLGQQPPFLDLQFNLNFDINDNTTKNKNFIQYNDYGDPDLWKTDPNTDLNEYGHFTIPEGSRSSITENVMACLNKAIDEASGDGLFYAPFLIRYCYRLFDGSMIMHSAPVLLFPMLQQPSVAGIRQLVKGDNVALEFAAFLLRAKLQMRRLSARPVVRELQEWSDIVKSVDIFISPQFTRINSSGLIETYGTYNNPATDKYSLLGIDSFMDGEEAISQNYQTVYDYFRIVYANSSPQGHNDWCFDIPQQEEEEFLSKIRDWGAFYKLTSTAVENLITSSSSEDSNDAFCTSLKDVDFGAYVLKNITVQEQMKDDYKTHNLLKPYGDNGGGLYVYNHRLNFYGISEILFKGFSPETMFPYTLASGDSDEHCTGVEVYVSTADGLRVVSNVLSSGYWSIPSWYAEKGYCFYPDSRAVLMKFDLSTDVLRRLSSAASLNGALSFMKDDSPSSVNISGAMANDVVPLLNKIYTSRADNPFYFPNLPDESGINSVGIGTIIGIAAVTRPLVSGEVGKQNLVVFSTDGIWVCEVSSTGTYTGMRNLSREVCADPDSICQLDQSIFFATNRSLSRFVESDVVSISKMLDGPYFDIKASFGGELVEGLYKDLDNGNTDNMKMLMDFKLSIDRYLETGRVIYDYTSMRIFVLPENYNKAETGVAKFVAMVYSIRDGAWSTMCLSKLRAAINSYPSPYIQDGEGKVICLDKPYDFNPAVNSQSTPPLPIKHKGLIVTRTLSFSDTMDVLRGFRQYTDASTMPTMYFYGSNDQKTWKYIGKTDREYYDYLPGHPYRFFRIGISLNMTTGEKYQQMELEVINKYAKL